MYFLYIKLLFPYVIATGARDRSLRVLGGRDISPDEFPFVVRLELKDDTTTYYRCTASALTPTTSLTAAHCCELADNLTLVIRYGSAQGRSTEDDRFSDVLSCSEHPAGLFSDAVRIKLIGRREVDVAVLATQPVHVSGYARLSAVDYRALYGQRVQALGYGVTEHNGEFDDTLALELPLQVMDAMWSRCDDHPIYHMVCLKKACGGRGGLCPGDSGGPVVHASGIVGIVAAGSGIGCQKVNDWRPGSFNVNFVTPLSAYVDWITDRLADTRMFRY